MLAVVAVALVLFDAHVDEVDVAIQVYKLLLLLWLRSLMFTFVDSD